MSLIESFLTICTTFISIFYDISTTSHNYTADPNNSCKLLVSARPDSYTINLVDHLNVSMKKTLDRVSDVRFDELLEAYYAIQLHRDENLPLELIDYGFLCVEKRLEVIDYLVNNNYVNFCNHTRLNFSRYTDKIKYYDLIY